MGVANYAETLYEQGEQCAGVRGSRSVWLKASEYGSRIWDDRHVVSVLM